MVPLLKAGGRRASDAKKKISKAANKALREKAAKSAVKEAPDEAATIT